MLKKNILRRSISIEENLPLLKGETPKMIIVRCFKYFSKNPSNLYFDNAYICTKNMKLLYLIILSFLTFLSCEEEGPTEPQKKIKIETILEEYRQCKEESRSTYCKTFTARAICEYNGVEDLKEKGEFVDYHKIHQIILSSSKWKNLGLANSQESLNNAQLMANKGFPVVAIDTKDKNKFSVIILQGEQSKSNKWDLNVPNCAAFFPTNYKRSFINKTLNYAWKRPEGIQLWVRK